MKRYWFYIIYGFCSLGLLFTGVFANYQLQQSCDSLRLELTEAMQPSPTTTVYQKGTYSRNDPNYKAVIFFSGTEQYKFISSDSGKTYILQTRK